MVLGISNLLIEIPSISAFFRSRWTCLDICARTGMDASDLSELEANVLQAVHAAGSADLYDLARAVGTGPRSVQKAVQRLSDERLVIVAERGVEVHCTPAGVDLSQELSAREH